MDRRILMAALAADAEQETAKKLESANGAEFDKMNVDTQISVHKKLLADQESYLESASDPNHANIAKLARGHTKGHLAILNTNQKAVA